MIKFNNKLVNIKNIYIPKDLEASKKIMIDKNLHGINSEDYIYLLKRLFLNLYANKKNIEIFYRTFNALNINLTYRNLVQGFESNDSSFIKLLYNIRFVDEPLSKLCKILIYNDLKYLILESNLLLFYEKKPLCNKIDEYKRSEKYLNLNEEEAFHEIITCLESAEYEFNKKFLIDHIINSLNQIESLGLTMTGKSALNKKLEEEANSISFEPSKLPNKPIPKNYLNTLSNEFDKTSLIDVYNFFVKELVDKKHLDKETLLDYIKIAFQDRQLPKKKYKLKTKQRDKIIDVFYQFYFKVSSRQHGRRDDYIKLLSNYFENFEFDKVKNNFRSKL